MPTTSLLALLAGLLQAPASPTPGVQTAKSPQFTESVRVLHELAGEAAGDQFGWEARRLGDADGDGVCDFIVSAPFKTLMGPNSGRIYVYSGKSGELLFQHDGGPQRFLGIGISGCGDVDGDGLADAIAGSRRRGGGTGRAMVYSGDGGEILHTLSVGEEGDEFGWKVSGAGDLDGDGHAELFVGAPGADAGGLDRGCAFVFSGADGSELFVLEGEEDGDGFGGVVAGELEGDSRLLVIGAPNAGPGDRGLAYVYRVEEDGEPELFFVIVPEESGVNLGNMFASLVGDVNGDGTHDVYVSDWEDAAKGPNTGRAYVYSGADGEPLHVLTGDQPGDGFGIGTAEAGDVDGDGCDDLVIGAWQSPAGAKSGGRVYVISGKTGERLSQFTCASPGETFGFDATGLGDIDGDGALDFLITGAYSPVTGNQSGRVLVIAGTAR